ncbi:hypothetical protein HF282_17780 [Acidithiobacillus ferrooxidans]|nr:hypothetical protein [Acidithiobacillus ferrooxidans]
MDTTVKGQVIVRQGDTGIIYVNGVQVAEEPNFLFSYNITALSAGLRKAMNRERSNVGRSAYTDLIKKILLESKSPKVSAAIAKNLKDLSNGTQRDELNWVDVQRHAVKILNTTGQYLFISAEDAMDHPDTIDHARAAGLDILILPEQLAQGLGNMRDQVGNPIRDLGEFVEEYNRSFQFSFIAPEHLTQSEQSVHALTSKIVVLFGGKPKQVKDIRISETMRQDLGNDATTQGCWDPQSQCIVISRRTLGSMAGYAGVLVHELIHARSGYSDVTRDFENALTDAIGRAYERLLPERGESVSVPISGVAEPKQGITILGKARRWWNGN